MDNLQRIAVLTSEIQAQALESALAGRDIPHIIVSHHDTAYDGLFQVVSGWGHVKASPEHKDEILAILAELEQGGD